MDPRKELDQNTHSEPPPILGTWPRVYGAVASYLITVITLFWLFTRAYRP
jgi:hypothetical protein